MRNKVSVSVYKAMSEEEFENEFYKHPKENIYLDKSKKGKYFFKYKSCPLWRYKFKNGKLTEAGALYFEGFWFYSSILLEDRKTN